MTFDLFSSPEPTPSPAPSPLLDGLNAEQAAAVTLPDAHALILAGAGSGKTRVLTTRIAWLLHMGRVSPGGILAVTFTNKAAREMQARLGAMLPLNIRGMWMGTFHGLCNRMLRAHHQAAQLPATFQILDMQDQQSAIKRLIKQFGVDEERFPPKQVMWFINGCKEEGMRPGDVSVRDEESRKKVELYQLYQDQCQREGVVDFAELLLRSYELLRDHAPIRDHYQRRFRHILVDEFQDTNRLQYLWLKQLAGTGSSVFAVGDDDQSIYAFRGARVGNMADFVREFDVQHQIKLEENYRSHGHILDSANALIAHNTQRLGKNLRTAQGAGEPVRVFEAPSDLAEAAWLVDEMKHLSRDDGVPLHEIAVLYRSNAQSRVIETALAQSGLAYRVYGGLRFFERAEIKHALAYLRLLETPSDDTSFLRVVNFPARGIGARSIEALQTQARALGLPLYTAAKGMTGRAGTLLQSFVALIEVMREQAQGLSLREVVDLMLEQSGLVEHYRGERDGGDRIENLQELASAAEAFVRLEGFHTDQAALPTTSEGVTLTQGLASQGLSGDALDQAMLESRDAPGGQPAPDYVDLDTGETLSPLAAFLTHAALEAGDNQAQAGQDAVQLMTVHASKGLEFDVVFITGLEEGLFPHENSAADTAGLEEERRLMYVAITRARQRLYLSHTQTRLLHGQSRYNFRSRFLDEVPSECVQWLTPKSGGFGSGVGASLAHGGQYGRMPAWSKDSGFGRSASNAYPGQPAWSAPNLTNAPLERPPVQTSAGQALRAGMQVFHNKFGEGKVLAVEGSGTDGKAQVSFTRHGTKWLSLAVAKLTVVET
ncbi:UvrD-helicase domain-containing protein [Comamonas serinivorans]|nr:UvrD-helicase domain-containing protein [Comamonas serinivorans]